jgi:hypothetical protein
MKIRNGFVSNSSSSSFLVVLNKALEDYTLEEFINECFTNEYLLNDKLCRFCAEQLFNDLLDLPRHKRDNEFNISYADDDGYFGAYMEHYFMEECKVVKNKESRH